VKLSGINNFIGSEAKHVVGDYLTYADFYLHHFYRNMRLAFDSAKSEINFEKYSNINRVVENYRNEDKLKDIVLETDKLLYYPPGAQKLNWW